MIDIRRPEDILLINAGAALGKAGEWGAEQLAARVGRVDKDTWSIILGLGLELLAYVSETRGWLPTEVNELIMVAGANTAMSGVYAKVTTGFRT